MNNESYSVKIKTTTQNDDLKENIVKNFSNVDYLCETICKINETTKKNSIRLLEI